MITILLKNILCKTHNYYWHEIYTKYATYKLQQLRLEQFSKVQLESKTLFIKKNTDYNDSFSGNGVIGILIRISDKLRRLQHITNTGITLINNETLRDTLLDLHNYAALGIMLLDE